MDPKTLELHKAMAELFNQFKDMQEAGLIRTVPGTGDPQGSRISETDNTQGSQERPPTDEQDTSKKDDPVQSFADDVDINDPGVSTLTLQPVPDPAEPQTADSVDFRYKWFGKREEALLNLAHDLGVASVEKLEESATVVDVDDEAPADDDDRDDRSTRVVSKIVRNRHEEAAVRWIQLACRGLNREVGMVGPFDVAEAKVKLGGHGDPFDPLRPSLSVMPKDFKLPEAGRDYSMVNQPLVKHLFQRRAMTHWNKRNDYDKNLERLANQFSRLAALQSVAIDALLTALDRVPPAAADAGGDGAVPDPVAAAKTLAADLDALGALCVNRAVVFKTLTNRHSRKTLLDCCNVPIALRDVLMAAPSLGGELFFDLEETVTNFYGKPAKHLERGLFTFVEPTPPPPPAQPQPPLSEVQAAVEAVQLQVATPAVTSGAVKRPQTELVAAETPSAKLVKQSSSSLARGRSPSPSPTTSNFTARGAGNRAASGNPWARSGSAGRVWDEPGRPGAALDDIARPADVGVKNPSAIPSLMSVNWQFDGGRQFGAGTDSLNSGAGGGWNENNRGRPLLNSVVGGNPNNSGGIADGVGVRRSLLGPGAPGGGFGRGGPAVPVGDNFDNRGPGWKESQGGVGIQANARIEEGRSNFGPSSGWNSGGRRVEGLGNTLRNDGWDNPRTDRDRDGWGGVGQGTGNVGLGAGNNQRSGGVEGWAPGNTQRSDSDGWAARNNRQTSNIDGWAAGNTRQSENDGWVGGKNFPSGTDDAWTAGNTQRSGNDGWAARKVPESGNKDAWTAGSKNSKERDGWSGGSVQQSGNNAWAPSSNNQLKGNDGWAAGGNIQRGGNDDGGGWGAGGNNQGGGKPGWVAGSMQRSSNDGGWSGAKPGWVAGSVQRSLNDGGAGDGGNDAWGQTAARGVAPGSVRGGGGFGPRGSSGPQPATPFTPLLGSRAGRGGFAGGSFASTSTPLIGRARSGLSAGDQGQRGGRGGMFGGGGGGMFGGRGAQSGGYGGYAGFGQQTRTQPPQTPTFRQPNPVSRLPPTLSANFQGAGRLPGGGDAPVRALLEKRTAEISSICDILGQGTMSFS